MKENLIIVDCYGFIFRAYHIHQDLMVNGKSVGALYGFTSMMLKLIKDFDPKQLVIVLDSGKKNFRHELFPQYKANRPELPSNLKDQLNLIDEMLNSFNFNVLKNSLYEADDLIASLACFQSNLENEVIIISSDKDMFQLIGKYIKIYDPIKNKFISEEDVVSKFGVTPDKMRDLQSLLGDSSDNIPGVKGIGIKTAAKLIKEFSNINNLLKSLDQISNLRQKKLLENSKEELLLSFELVGLKNNINIENVETSWHVPNNGKEISQFLKKYHFKSLYKRAESLFQINISSEIFSEKDKYELYLLAREEELLEIIDFVRKNDFLAIYADTESEFLYLFFEKDDKDNFIYQINLNQDLLNLEKFWKILSSAEVKKITFNLKKLLHKLQGRIDFCEDIALMDYVVNSGKRNRNISKIIVDIDWENIEFENDYRYLPFYYKIYESLEQRLVKENAYFLYFIERNISYILYQMEVEGISLDEAYLSKISNEFSIKISQLEKKIFDISQEKFNILSPKQLSQILFEKLKLPYSKISQKSQNLSTNVDILEKLSLENYEIATLVLQYRHLSKLNNTYAKALPKYVDINDKRVHSHFLQTYTSTGRITSSEPNLQNIPIKTPEGAMIRRAFIAADGYKICSCDYSQIELRILAAIANVRLLQKAFAEGKDIHTSTAAQIFSIPELNVTKELRYKAKTINFSIIYGIKSFTLAQRLNISHQESVEYLKKYFDNYPEIKEYMEQMSHFVKNNYFVQNYFGRKIYVPEITSNNFQLREFAKRAAINAPIQSCAAEIIKIAMIKISNELKKHNFDTKMLLQIHDELVFEVKDSDLDEFSTLVKNNMKNAFTLNVPIEVSFKTGKNFLDLE
ncbi:MAG: DNA polymerase I [Rickettsia sp.]|nr:DNA polymerase I [Rickettsia sp.]